MLPDGTVLFLCQEGENPSQLVCFYFDIFQHKAVQKKKKKCSYIYTFCIVERRE